MSRRAANPGTLVLNLDPEDPVPLYRQIYHGIRRAVLEGRLTAGARLPSTRSLAAELDVARNTVMTAYRQLVAEGFLESRVGAGTRVARELRPELVGARDDPSDRGAPRGRRWLPDRADRWTTLELRSGRTEPGDRAIPFDLGVPALDLFPQRLWARLAGRHWRNVEPEGLTYGDPMGDPRLRRAIAGYLGPARGVVCDPEQVLIVSGSQQALALAARVLTEPGAPVWVEEPGYWGARYPLEAAGARVVPVPVDEEGLDVSAGRQLASDGRLVSVTPSHHFPLGMTLSLRRRLALLRWASRSGAWIVEDDYDSEYRYAGRPLMALQGLDTDRRVLYIGTFSKTLAPALRLGYLVLPPDLVDPFRAARSLIDQHPPAVPQAVLADFLEEGHFVRHVRRMREVYQERRNVFLEAVDRELSDLLEIAPSDTGLHLAGWLREGLDDRAAWRAALEARVRTLPLSAFYAGVPPRPGLVFGYASSAPETIRKAVRRLAGALRSCRGGA